MQVRKDIFILYLIITDSYGAHSIETYLNRPEKDGRVFSSQSVFGWSRSHFSWMGGEGGEGVSLREVLTPQHRTEIRINTAQKNIRKRKTGLKLPKISKYRKPLGFVKRQYRNLKITISANRITANPYIPLLVKALTVGIIECCLLASSVVYLRV